MLFRSDENNIFPRIYDPEDISRIPNPEKITRIHLARLQTISDTAIRNAVKTFPNLEIITLPPSLFANLATITKDYLREETDIKFKIAKVAERQTQTKFLEGILAIRNIDEIKNLEEDVVKDVHAVHIVNQVGTTKEAFKLLKEKIPGLETIYFAPFLYDYKIDASKRKRELLESLGIEVKVGFFHD